MLELGGELSYRELENVGLDVDLVLLCLPTNEERKEVLN